MKKPLIVMALESEGQGQIEKLGFEVLYCGVGKINAAYNLTRHLVSAHHRGQQYPYILNLGSAGSSRFNKGSLVAADRFVQRDMDVTGLGFEMGVTPFEEHPHTLIFTRNFTGIEYGLCGSGDSFLQGKCPLSSDIIDMEAYALAKVCLQEKQLFSSVKYITDGADEKASDDWQSNLKDAASAFTRFLTTQV